MLGLSVCNCFYNYCYPHRPRVSRLTLSGPQLKRNTSKGTNINPFTPKEINTRGKRSREESERF